jgi:hypothetical protein
MKKAISLLLAITLPIWVLPVFIVGVISVGIYEAYLKIDNFLWGKK